ncbi:EF-hand domain-containing protein [Simiduia agarivorans]|uniref:EF-hand domain-containing protein n=1 Tax=Simiduia agarivorans (strain DSM 21679 / JCM 13881 / BCRC 17597 / SA1) TaxID=1117647 RepID=K4KXY8_SIMAS|nr:hypothetical protein [Simiduia agarivorans]AFU98797.1 hypothetical protein M5M_08040 [Simiduia agarivorans SA1 = DSM 21679]
MNVFKLTAALCLASVGALAQADSSASGNNWLLAKYDLNGDTVISQEEITAKKLDIFRLMDLNTSGGVSFDEYEQVDAARRNMLLKARFNKLDQDKNGEVTEAEYSSFLGQFSSIDANGDGILDSQEIMPEEEHETHCFYWFCLRLDKD